MNWVHTRLKVVSVEDNCCIIWNRTLIKIQVKNTPNLESVVRKTKFFRDYTLSFLQSREWIVYSDTK